MAHDANWAIATAFDETNRALRISGAYVPQASGFVGDGTTDDTVAIQAAIDATPAGGVLILPPSLNGYAVSTLTVNKAMTIRSFGEKESVKFVAKATGAGTMMTVDSGGTITGFKLQGIGFDMGAELSATGLKLRGCQRALIEDVRFRLGATGMDIATSGSCDFNGIQCAAQTAAGVLLNGDGGLEHRFTDLTIARSGAGTTARGFYCTRTTTTDTGGLYFKGLRITNSVGTTTTGVEINCSGGTTTIPTFFAPDTIIDGPTTDLKMTSAAQVFIIGGWFVPATLSIQIVGGSDVWITGGTKLKNLQLDTAPAALHIDDCTFSGTPGITVDSGAAPTSVFLGSNNRFTSTVTNDAAVLGAALSNGSVNGAAAVEIDPKHTPAAVTGTWALTANGSQIGGGWMRNTSAALNDKADFVLPPMQPGTWTFELLIATLAAGGIITVQVDDGAGNFTSIGTIDTYSAGTVFNVLSALTGVSVPMVVGGKRTIRFLMATKNASSSAYQANITHLRARKTS